MVSESSSITLGIERPSGSKPPTPAPTVHESQAVAESETESNAAAKTRGRPPMGRVSIIGIVKGDPSQTFGFGFTQVGDGFEVDHIDVGGLADAAGVCGPLDIVLMAGISVLFGLSRIRPSHVW